MFNKKHSIQIPEERKQDLKEAEKSLRKLNEEISPFIKRRIIKQQSTIGKWCDTTNLITIK